MGFLKKIFGRSADKVEVNVRDLPSSYFVGQEYVLDPKRVRVEIHLIFISPGEITKTKLDANGKQILLDQNGSLFRAIFEEDLSEVLLASIKEKHVGDQWILGYVAEVMPYINQEILRQRYVTGHFLVRTYSSLDISQLWIVNKRLGEKIRVSWPGSLAAFPEVVNLAPKYDRIYLRDLIDSMHAYFNGDYEESIRKIITSVETFIKYQNLQTKKISYKTDFEEAVRANMNIQCPMIQKNAADVIMDSYRVRNEIVHDGKRLEPAEGKKLAKIGTHMVNEVYKNFGTEEELKRYAFYLEGQFLMQENFLCEDGLTLKWLEEFK